MSPNTLLPYRLAGLQRPHQGALVAGVCRALSQRWGIDVTVLRVAAVLLGISSGLGVMLYAWAWLTIPLEGRSTPLLEQWIPDARNWSDQTHLLVLAGACLVSLLVGGALTPWSIGPALVLACVVLLSRRAAAQRTDQGAMLPTSSSQQPPMVLDPTTHFGRAALAWTTRLDEVVTGRPAPPVTMPGYQLARDEPVTTPPATIPPAAVSAPQSPVWLAPTRRPAGQLVAAPGPARCRRGSWLWGLAVAAVATGSGLLAASTAMGAASTSLDPARLGCSVALAVVAASLLLTHLLRLPRPRLAILAGLVLSVQTLLPGAWLAQSQLNGVHQTVAWASPQQLPEAPQVANASKVTYDLTALPAGASGTLRLEANASKVIVLVPSDVTLRVDYRLQGADLLLREQNQPPTRVSGVSTASWPSGGDRTAALVVDLMARASTVEVRHG